MPWNATIVRRRDVGERVVLLWVRPDSGAVQDFEPGQFIQLGWPRPRAADAGPEERVRFVKRSYSIASSPAEREGYELCLALVQEGTLTPRLWELSEGARVWCNDAPVGHFTLARVPHGARLVLVATGTGIAPYVSMLRRYRGTGRWHDVCIVHGARAAADLPYDDELRQAARADASVRYVPVLSREPAASGWRGARGRVQSVLEPAAFARAAGWPLDPAEAHVFLCGNPAMIEHVRALLEGRGFRPNLAAGPGNLHFERYW